MTLYRFEWKRWTGPWVQTFVVRDSMTAALLNGLALDTIPLEATEFRAVAVEAIGRCTGEVR